LEEGEADEKKGKMFRRTPINSEEPLTSLLMFEAANPSSPTSEVKNLCKATDQRVRDSQQKSHFITGEVQHALIQHYFDTANETSSFSNDCDESIRWQALVRVLLGIFVEVLARWNACYPFSLLFCKEDSETNAFLLSCDFSNDQQHTFVEMLQLLPLTEKKGERDQDRKREVYLSSSVQQLLFMVRPRNMEDEEEEEKSTNMELQLRCEIISPVDASNENNISSRPTILMIKL